MAMSGEGKVIIGIYAATVVVAIAAVYGWIANIVKFFGASFDPLTGAVVLRGIGVFVPPIGAIMGFL